MVSFNYILGDFLGTCSSERGIEISNSNLHWVLIKKNLVLLHVF